mmetsp:Transcript_28969/g.35239  ORF Transcript_28969/g.35239 Transcript_28969/m.35239 type:complete len:277 (+) Transcript_28969:1041-1871(+)
MLSLPPSNLFRDFVNFLVRDNVLATAWTRRVLTDFEPFDYTVLVEPMWAFRGYVRFTLLVIAKTNTTNGILKNVPDRNIHQRNTPLVRQHTLHHTLIHTHIHVLTPCPLQIHLQRMRRRRRCTVLRTPLLLRLRLMTHPIQNHTQRLPPLIPRNVIPTTPPSSDTPRVVVVVPMINNHLPPVVQPNEPTQRNVKPSVAKVNPSVQHVILIDIKRPESHNTKKNDGIQQRQNKQYRRHEKKRRDHIVGEAGTMLGRSHDGVVPLVLILIIVWVRDGR